MKNLRIAILVGLVAAVGVGLAARAVTGAVERAQRSRALFMVFRADCRIVHDVRIDPDGEWWTDDGVHFAIREGVTVVWPACDSDECWDRALDAVSGPAFDARAECVP